MLSTDLSNVWCKVSLPTLLEEERKIFDAHLVLGGGRQKLGGWLSFLEREDPSRPKWLEDVLSLAESVKAHSRYLVVVGGGLTALGARGLVELSPPPGGVKLLFCGDDYAESTWKSLENTLLDNAFSVLAISPSGEDLGVLIALRSLRRMLEASCEEHPQERIFVSAPEDSSLGKVALAEEFALLPLLSTPDGENSVLNPAGLFLLHTAGFRVKELCRGAAMALEELDLRSFENPLWLYVGARVALAKQGYFKETLCLTRPEEEAFGLWWKCLMQSALGADAGYASWDCTVLPRDLSRRGGSLFAKGSFLTFFRLPGEGNPMPVEMDWKDADGLNCLSGKKFSHVSDALLTATELLLSQKQVPTLSLDADEHQGEETMGKLLVFFELSAALLAKTWGHSPFHREEEESIFRRTDALLARDSSNSSI